LGATVVETKVPRTSWWNFLAPDWLSELPEFAGLYSRGRQE
jgi:hypothetical protein